MNKARFVSGLIATLAIAVLPGAQATMITYQLFDHPDGQLSSPVSPYGIRVDAFTGGASTFSVSQFGANVTLLWDTVANTATISGRVYDNDDSILRDVSYSMTGLQSAPPGNSGFVVPGATPQPELEIGPPGSFTIPGLGNGASPTSLIFEFISDDHRLNSDGSYACSGGSPALGCILPANTIVGRGWLDGTGTNDFLVTAQVVPLPAALWLLLSGIGALFGARRLSRLRT